MKIIFKTKKLGKEFTSSRALQKAYGDLSRAIMLKMRLLEAAENLSDAFKIPALRLHELRGDRKGQYGITIRANYRIVIEAVETSPGVTEITIVKVIEIIDYH